MKRTLSSAICTLVSVPSHVMLPKHEEAPSTLQRPLSAMGEACSRMDLTTIYQILVITHYKDDEETIKESQIRNASSYLLKKHRV
ncbi:serine/threonine-protein kinase BSK1-like [Juglans regia]|uniref:Serine/threonine-protein kinase BSK1-like n=1 Tax=Juglans regia TaxID=51240 RepID=A0A6P9E395_JUGRE|nr:serine/threonine-protein kinase BSK1-like [Juglans regia]